jgi:hypothetical protein
MGKSTITVSRQQIPYTTELETLSCGECEIPFAIPSSRHRKLETDQRKAAERKSSARKGVITRMRGKLAQGKCTECDTDFPDLAGHMHEAHPDFEKADS